jgi:hypothetical protein
MNNQYAVSRLMIWSEWLLKKDTGATGYPKQCNYTKLVQIRGGIGFSPDMDAEAHMVDKFMTQLKRDDVKLFEITSMCFCIKWVDVGNGVYQAAHTRLSNQQAVADHFKCSQSTINDKLHKVYRLLLDYLLDCE